MRRFEIFITPQDFPTIKLAEGCVYATNKVVISYECGALIIHDCLEKAEQEINMPNFKKEIKWIDEE